MKRIVVAISLLSAVLSAGAQDLFDASRYANTDIMGTARYMSLAGSMGAIGGDPSAVLDNPGALGIYRSSEVSFTLNATPSVTFARTTDYGAQSRDFFFNFNQLSYVLAIPSGKETGYVSSNFSFTYNRLKDFNRTVYMRDGQQASSMAGMIADMTEGFAPSAVTVDNLYAPFLSVLGYESWAISPSTADSTLYVPTDYVRNEMAYRAVESGRVDEYNISYAANVGHYLYIGAGVGIQTLNYRLSSSNGEIYTNGGDFTLSNVFSSTGVGAVLRVGVIARPLSFMRLGFSFQSPVWYSISDRYYGSASATGLPGQTGADISTGYEYNDYDFNSPLKFQASVGFILGKAGFINFDYQYTDNKGMRLIDPSAESGGLFSQPVYSFENEQLRRDALTSHLFKLGAEFRVAQQFSFRAGFAYETQNMSSSASRYMRDNTARTDVEMFYDMGSLYAAGGFGYRYNGFGIDITYAYSRHNQQFAPFQQGAKLDAESGYFGLPAGVEVPKPLAEVHTNRHNVILTLLYKF